MDHTGDLQSFAVPPLIFSLDCIFSYFCWLLDSEESLEIHALHSLKESHCQYLSQVVTHPWLDCSSNRSSPLSEGIGPFDEQL